MATVKGLVNSFGTTVSLLANVTTTVFVYAARGGLIEAFAMTFALGGFTVTGARYTVADGAIIDTSGGGANYFPGSSAGTGTNFGAAPYGLYE